MTKGVRVSDGNPWDWEYDGEPTLLVGGTNTDNLQRTGDRLRNHLDDLVAAAGTTSGPRSRTGG